MKERVLWACGACAAAAALLAVLGISFSRNGRKARRMGMAAHA